MDIKRRQPLGIELVKKGLVTGEHIQKALDFQEKNPNVKIGDALAILELADPEVLIKAVGEILGQKGIYLKYGNVTIDIADYLPLDLMKRYKAIPFDIEGGKIKVCFADVRNNQVNINNIKMLMLNKGLVMEQYIGFESNVDDFLRRYESEISKNLDELEKAESVTELVDNMIKLGMEKRASDIHIEPQADSVRVRFRIDGQLFTMAKISKDKQTQMIGRLKAISNMHQEKQDSQDGRILIYDNYNIRVSSQKNIYGEKFVLRLLKKSSKIRDIFELGFPYDEHTLNKAVNKKNSITIMAAPTGEGKTTTLYSILDYLNSESLNITTIEDPVEIRIPGLNQIEIEKNIRFADSLRTILRQDPDIILVGEIRDQETAEIAVQAGQTGHYVLSTIHTIDSIEVITRLRKMGVSNYDISSTVGTTISQRLLRRMCPKCKRARPFSSREKEIIQKICDKYAVKYDLENNMTYDAIGCEFCNNSGYYERVGIFEILNISDEIKDLIVQGGSTIEIRKKAIEEGYKPLIIDGIKKVIDGETNIEELNRKLLVYNNL